MKLIESLKDKNYLLSELTKGTIPLAKLRLKADPAHSVALRRVRAKASDLYAALETSWSCSCPSSHEANLRLETRLVGGLKMSHGELLQPGNKPDGFRVVFCLDSQPDVDQQHPGTWKAPDILPWNSGAKHEGSVPRADTKKVSFAETSQNSKLQLTAEDVSALSKIDSLCDALRGNVQTVDVQSSTLGLLLGQPGLSYCLYLIQDVWMHDNQPRSTLSDMLTTTSGAIRTPNSSCLSLKDRIEVAVKLACTVLQLHCSPWLDDKWTSNDIVLLQNRSKVNKETQLEPYVKRAFRGSTSKNTQPTRDIGKAPKTRIGIRNETIFALGLVLLELAYNRPLQHFRQPEDLNDDGTPNAFTDMTVAARLEPTVEREVGPVYATVVRRCLHCTFDVGNPDLENEEFHRAVYIGVVKPLMSMLDLWG